MGRSCHVSVVFLIRDGSGNVERIVCTCMSAVLVSKRNGG